MPLLSLGDFDQANSELEVLHLDPWVPGVFCKDYRALCTQSLCPSVHLYSYSSPISEPQSMQSPVTGSTQLVIRVPWPGSAPFCALPHPSSPSGCKPVITATKPTSNSHDVISLDSSSLSLQSPYRGHRYPGYKYFKDFWPKIENFIPGVGAGIRALSHCAQYPVWLRVHCVLALMLSLVLQREG